MIRSTVMLLYGGFILLLAVRSLRAHRLKEAHVLLFVAVGLPFLALAVWPAGIDRFAAWMKVEKPTVMILCLTAFLIIMLFRLFSIVSVQEQRIRTLTQIVGILTEKQRRTGPDGRLPDDAAARPE